MKKVFALLICVMLCFTACFCSMGTVSATVSDTNLISGLMPTAFMAVADGATSFDWTKMRGPNAEYSWYGFDTTASHGTYGAGGSAYNNWSPYVAKLTDGSVAEDFLLRAEDTSKDILIAYEMAESNVTGFSMDGISCTSIDVYVSNTYATLFSSVLTTATPSDSTASAEFSVSGATFIGFRLNGCNCRMKEISVYGHEPVVFTDPNVASGLMPTAFMAVADGATSFDWTKMRGPNAEYSWYGFDTTASHGTYGAGGSAYTQWAPYVAKLTDGSVAENFLLRAEDTSKDILIVYEIEESDLTGFSMAGISCSSIDVYASDNYATLFDSALKTFTLYNSSVSVELSTSRTTFIGFRLNNCNTYIQEISVYGKFCLPRFRTHSLVLAEEIGVNFFMDLNALSAAEKEESYMTFAVTHCDLALRADFDSEAVNASGYYCFTCPISSVEMAETIVPTLHYGDGMTLTGSPFSVKDYIDYVVANSGSFDSSVVTLVKALGDYGHYAQVYLDNKNDWEAGRDYTVMPKYRDADYTSAMHTGYASSLASEAIVKNIDGSAVTKVTYNLNFDTTTYVNVKMVTSGPITASAVVNRQTVSASDMGGYYQLRTPGLPIAKLGDRFTITGSDGTNSFTVTLSGLSYIRSILSQATETYDGAKNAMASLYDYYTAATNYITYDENLSGEYVNE